jgi:hypothetical protein
MRAQSIRSPAQRQRPTGLHWLGERAPLCRDHARRDRIRRRPHRAIEEAAALEQFRRCLLPGGACTARVVIRPCTALFPLMVP